MNDIQYKIKHSIYPFHESDKYIWAWRFRRDFHGRPILHSLRIKRYPKVFGKGNALCRNSSRITNGRMPNGSG